MGPSNAQRAALFDHLVGASSGAGGKQVVKERRHGALVVGGRWGRAP